MVIPARTAPSSATVSPSPNKSLIILVRILIALVPDARGLSPQPGYRHNNVALYGASGASILALRRNPWDRSQKNRLWSASLACIFISAKYHGLPAGPEWLSGRVPGREVEGGAMTPHSISAGVSATEHCHSTAKPARRGRAQRSRTEFRHGQRYHPGAVRRSDRRSRALRLH